MRTVRRMLVVVLVVTLTAGVVAEYFGRRSVERRYKQSMEERRQLELQFGEILATHDQLKAELAQERQRSKNLVDALQNMQAQLDQTTNRLSAESRTIEELQTRLGSMQEQMNQLQGELSVAIQQHTGKAADGTVQLERIVVNSGQSAATKGHVLSVHPEWNFVVVDLGWDTVRIGDTISIFRDEQLLARARVERVQEGVCAATLLPEFIHVEIRPNDLAKIL